MSTQLFKQPFKKAYLKQCIICGCEEGLSTDVKQGCQLFKTPTTHDELGFVVFAHYPSVLSLITLR